MGRVITGLVFGVFQPGEVVLQAGFPMTMQTCALPERPSTEFPLSRSSCGFDFPLEGLTADAAATFVPGTYRIYERRFLSLQLTRGS